MKNDQQQIRRPAAVARASRFARRLRQSTVIGALAALVVFGALSQPEVSFADEPPAAAAVAPEEIERQAEAIARSIMSPFCPGRTVSACPNAGPWRDDIRRWVAEGVDSAEIKRRLAERVPNHNLSGAPKNRLGWALPIGLGLAALGVLVFLLRYLTSAKRAGAAPARSGRGPEEPARPKTSEGPAGTKKDDYDARLEQELETFEQ